MALPILGVLGSILGSGDVISKGMDLIDDAWETDAEVRESKTQAKIDLMKAYAPFKVAQRWLAILFAVNFFAGFWMVMVMTLMGKVTNVEQVFDVLEQFKIGWAMITILTFYFGGGLVESGGRVFGKKKDGGEG